MILQGVLIDIGRFVDVVAAPHPFNAMAITLVTFGLVFPSDKRSCDGLSVHTPHDVASRSEVLSMIARQPPRTARFLLRSRELTRHVLLAWGRWLPMALSRGSDVCA
jgi:hypothetical protein